MFIFNGNKCSDICLKSKNEYVFLAVQDLISDFERVSSCGCLPRITENESENCIVIEENPSQSSAPISSEGFTIKTENDKIRICGDGYLGTMWGIYTFSEKILGVSPCYIFEDFPIKKRESLKIDEISISDKPQTFGFRGVFLNDEDLLTGWKSGGGIRFLNYNHYGITASPKAIANVVETMLRLRMNLVIPASFLDIDNPYEKALADEVARRGIFVSQHHIEPCGVSAYTFENYCRRNGLPSEFSYITNPKTVERVWEHYAERWAQYPNVVWQIGLRGKGDRPVWHNDNPTDEELCNYAAFISGAYQRQKEIILEKTENRAKYFTTTLWMEGSSLMQKGYLELPSDTITVFSDNGPDQMYGGDFYKTERKSESGIYYHLQYNPTGPHLAPLTGLDKLMYNVSLARKMGDTSYFIVNLSNTREFTYEINALSKILWDTDRFSKSEYLDYYANRFGERSDSVKSLVKKYYDIIPALSDELLSLHFANYFNYAYITPDGIKTFTAKDGVICFIGKELLASFKKPYNSRLAFGICDAVRGAIPKYEELRHELEILSEGLCDGEKLHIKCKWLLYTDLMLSLYKWFVRMCDAKKAYDSEKGDEALEAITEAISVLASHLSYRKIAEYGEFEGWYRGERKCDISRLFRESCELIDINPEYSFGNSN
ncbi:MAG: glycosyl hydrolase 115 family protein [Clostridia bacterium]|nr:glycosyl hydrolase 115 family protein [Clostridia bacterium]